MPAIPKQERREEDPCALPVSQPGYLGEIQVYETVGNN